jgi:hypothetical protein
MLSGHPHLLPWLPANEERSSLRYCGLACAYSTFQPLQVGKHRLFLGLELVPGYSEPAQEDSTLATFTVTASPG